MLKIFKRKPQRKFLVKIQYKIKNRSCGIVMEYYIFARDQLEALKKGLIVFSEPFDDELMHIFVERVD